MYYHHVHLSSTVLLTRRLVKYYIFALYIKSRCRLRRSSRDARLPLPSSSLSSSSLRSQQRRRRCRCRGILLAASAASVAAVAAVAAGIAPPSSAAAASSSSVAVDASLPPPLPPQPLHSRRSRSASPLSHPRPRKTSSLPTFGVISGVAVGRGRFSDYYSPLSSVGARIRRRCRRRNGEIG